ncbi:MAG TPA: FixH family protein [Polyangiaceae bacterium]
MTLGARIWPFVPAALLVCMLTGLGSMAAIAADDPGFALERDYYRKAVAYDREIAQRGENARLAWSAQTELGSASPGASTELVVRLRDQKGPVTGAMLSVEALRNATAARVLETKLAERAPGEYAGHLSMARGGLWELRLTAERGGERFTSVERRDVVEARP